MQHTLHAWIRRLIFAIGVLENGEIVLWCSTLQEKIHMAFTNDRLHRKLWFYNWLKNSCTHAIINFYWTCKRRSFRVLFITFFKFQTARNSVITSKYSNNLSMHKSSNWVADMSSIGKTENRIMWIRDDFFRIKLCLRNNFWDIMGLRMNQSAATICNLLLRYLKTIAKFDVELIL